MFIGIGLPLTASHSSVAPLAYSPQALQFFARVPSLTDVYSKNVISDLIDALVADGIWDRYDDLVIPGLLPNTTAARQNLINANFTMSLVGNPGFIAYRGFKSISTAHIRMNYTILTQGVRAQRDDMSMFVYILDEAVPGSLNAAVIGATNQGSWSGSMAVGYSNPVTNGFLARNNSVFGNQVDGVAPFGMFISNRSGANATQMRHDGAFINNGVDASQAPVDLQMYLLSSNYLGAAYGTSRHRIAAAGVGGSLTPAQQVSFGAHLATALTAVGAL